MAPLVWFITGSTSGFGAALVQEITSRGDKVIATGRNVEDKIGHLKSDNIAILELDVAADSTEMNAKFQEAWKIFGHIDVVVNNAGISRSSTGEEAEDELIQNIFNINTLAPMRLTQAALPLFRQQGSGKVIFISSSATTQPLPFLTHYAATKAALTTWAYGLSAEVRHLGIEVMVVEPGGSKTSLGAPREGVRGGEGFGAKPPGEAYQSLFQDFVGNFATDPDMFFVGDPLKAAVAMVDAIKQERMAAGKTFPLHLTLGSDALGIARRKAEIRLKGLAEWEAVSKSTDRPGSDDRGMRKMMKLTAGLEE